eukprot:12138021-Ditylum_brightwellii.AAC.1
MQQQLSEQEVVFGWPPLFQKNKKRHLGVKVVIKLDYNDGSKLGIKDGIKLGSVDGIKDDIKLRSDDGIELDIKDVINLGSKDGNKQLQ